MALTKVQQNLSSTPSISDSGTSTAITIDSSNNVSLAGNLSVTGSTTTADNLNSADKNITLNYHASNDTSGSADGAGITIQDAVDASTNASLYWRASDDKFIFSHPLRMFGQFELPDNVKMVAGDGNDLQLYHDGSNSYIKNTVGWINMPITQNGLSIANSDFSESIARFLVNGACELYYDGSKKIATATDGVDITGTLDVSGAATVASINASGGYLNGSNGGIRIHTNGTKFFNVTAANAARDNIMDVGASDARFKDGWFGGTVSAVNFKVNNSQGSDGQVLTSTGSGVAWEAVSSGADGITASGSNTIIQSPDDTNVIHVNNSAEVGIGTASPDYNLEVEFAAGNHTTGAAITNSQAGGYGSALSFVSERSDNNAHTIAARIRTEGGDSWNTDASTDSNLKFETVSANTLATKMTIKHDGSVGIGTTSPGHPLHIVESADGTKIRLTRGGVCEWDFSIGNSSTLTGVGSGALELLPKNANTANEFAIGTAGSTAPLFWLTNSQNYFKEKVGIGHTSPVAELDIVGAGYEQIRIGSNRTDNTNKTAGITSYMYTNNSVSVFQGFFQNGSNAIYYGSADGAHRGINQHYFYTNSDYNATSGHKLRYVINGNGSHKFYGDHQGDAEGHFKFTNQNGADSGTTNCTLSVVNGAQFVQIMPWSSLGARIGTRTGGWNSNAGGNCYLTGQDATCLVLKSNGTAYLANGSTAVTSDERLKKDITDMADGQLAKINQLKVRNFKWKDERKPEPQVGLIAQEVETIMPEAIEETEFAPDPDDTSRDFDGDVKIVKYGDVQMKLLKAVQELSAKLEAAEARITTLEG